MKVFFYRLLTIIILLGSVSVSAQGNWTKFPGNPLNIHGIAGAWNQSVVTPYVIFNSDSSRYEMWFTAYTGATPNPGIGFTYSSDGITWVPPTLVMIPGPAGWETLFVGGVS